MTSRPAEVLVMEAPLERAELDGLLGPERTSRLEAELQDRARAFARRVAPRGFHTAPAEARLSEAIQLVYGEGARPPGGTPHPGPLLVVWPELLGLGGRHAAGALGDLQSGADVVFGAVIDGRLYLLGLRQAFPDLLERLDVALDGDDLGTLGLAAASDMGLEIGLLRVERGLRTVSDVEAALADPLTPAGVRRILLGGD